MFGIFNKANTTKESSKNEIADTVTILLQSARMVKELSEKEGLVDGSTERSERHYLDCVSSLLYWASRNEALPSIFYELPIGSYSKYLNKSIAEGNQNDFDIIMFLTLRNCLTVEIGRAHV